MSVRRRREFGIATIPTTVERGPARDTFATARALRQLALDTPDLVYSKREPSRPSLSPDPVRSAAVDERPAVATARASNAPHNLSPLQDERPSLSVRKEDNVMCKRPKDNAPNKGGSGPRRFIPWNC